MILAFRVIYRAESVVRHLRTCSTLFRRSLASPACRSRDRNVGSDREARADLELQGRQHRLRGRNANLALAAKVLVDLGGGELLAELPGLEPELVAIHASPVELRTDRPRDR